LAEHGLSLPSSGAFKRATRTEKLVVLVLLFVLLLAAILGVTSVLKGPDWAALWKSLLFGLLLGWALALWRRPPALAALIVATLGAIYVLLFPGRLGVKLITSVIEVVRLGWPLVTSWQGPGIDWSPLLHPLMEFSTSSGVVIERVRVWVVALVAGQPTFDPVAAALTWSLLAWIVAAWAGWVVEARRNALLAVLPALLLSAGTLSYGGRMSVTLYLMLGATLLLLATIQYGRREQEWITTDVAYPKEKGRQIGMAAFLVTIALVVLAALLSSISIQRIRNWISEHRQPATQQDNQLAKSLGIIPGGTRIPDAFETVRRPGLPQSHLIGSGPELSRRIVMTVSIPNLSAFSGESLPLYWHSFTYDTYTGHGWSTSPTRQSVYSQGESLQPEQARDHVLVRQEVHPVENTGGVVFSNGDLVKVNLQSEAAWRSSDDLFGVQLESGGIASYNVDSLVPVADVRTLRAAGQRYPDWVRQRYLALPPEVPERVKSLAITLTASAATPYDRAHAIEQYLRTFPYTLDVPRPPSNQDVTDYFLFDLKKGYCDYYATAMVVLARAAGVPARLVTGYASGAYNLNSERFVVTEADAHSWVEVYFPNIGWVPFEPTAGNPPLERTRQASSAITPESAPPSQTSAASQAQPISRIGLILFSGLVLTGLLGVAWNSFDAMRLRRLSEQATAAEIYRRLRRHAAFLKIVSDPGATVYEFAALLSAGVCEMAVQTAANDFGIRTARNVDSIANEIVRVNYSSDQEKAVRPSTVLLQWNTLRWRLRMVQALKSWNDLHQRFMEGLNRDIAQPEEEL
jgi:transglutaminase-like putative cysteine protease